MTKCPICSKELISKEGTKKVCAQIGNPDIAIVEVKNPCFCDNCNEYYLSTEEMISAVNQIKKLKQSGEKSKVIDKGIYT